MRAVFSTDLVSVLEDFNRAIHFEFVELGEVTKTYRYLLDGCTVNIVNKYMIYRK